MENLHEFENFNNNSLQNMQDNLVNANLISDIHPWYFQFLLSFSIYVLEWIISIILTFPINILIIAILVLIFTFKVVRSIFSVFFAKVQRKRDVNLLKKQFQQMKSEIDSIKAEFRAIKQRISDEKANIMDKMQEEQGIKDQQQGDLRTGQMNSQLDGKIGHILNEVGQTQQFADALDQQLRKSMDEVVHTLKNINSNTV